VADVTLSRLWLHRADDLETFLTFDAFTISPVTAKIGSVRTLAGGRRRAVSRPGISTVLAVAVVATDRDSRETLESWIGTPLLLRDARGRKVWGTYFSTRAIERPPTHFVDVSFSFEELTIAEAV
jgi:hypothetical protein